MATSQQESTESFEEGLILSGDKLRSFCQEKKLRTDTTFWQEKIRREFGHHPQFLIAKQYLDLSEDTYFSLQQSYDHLVKSAEEYFITLTNEQKKEKKDTHFNLFIPEPTLQGIALAVFIGNLPIIIRSLDGVDETNMERLEKEAPEIDLVDLGSSLVLTSGDEITIDELETDLESLSNYTLHLSNGPEEIIVTGVNYLTIQGFINAFSWIRDTHLEGKVYRPQEIGPHWQDYLLAVYVKDDDELVRFDLKNFTK